MKAASSEWYTTASSRHALPLPHHHSPAVSTTSSTKSHERRRHHKSGRSSLLHDYALSNPSSSNEFPSSRYSTGGEGGGGGASSYDRHGRRRTTSVLSDLRSQTKSQSRSGSESFSKSESARGSESFSETTRTTDSYGEGRSGSKSKSTTPSFIPSLSTSLSSSAYYISANSDKYKDRVASIYSSHYSYGSSTGLSRAPTTTNLSEAERRSTFAGGTTTELDEEESSNVYTTEEGDSEEEEENDDDDDDVYKSFKESLMMLRPSPRPTTTTTQLRFKSPSVSPSVSLRSVITELEEDEEDRPPEQVDEDLQFTTEEEEEGEDDGRGATTPPSSDSFSRSYLRHVPKSPVKVRVKVEKATPDRDDKVKVTVRFEDEYDEEESEDEESSEDEDETSATTSTADTVRRRGSVGNRSSRSYDDDEDESGSDEDGSGTENSLSEEEEEENESERSIHDKTESQILTTSGTTTSFQDSSFTTSGTHSNSQTTTTTTHTSISSTDKSSTERSDERGERDIDDSPVHNNPVPPSSHSSNSSRSHSARSSPDGRRSAKRHKMYSTGGKIRSLSARIGHYSPLPTLGPTVRRNNTYTLHPFNEDEDSESSPSLTKAPSTSSQSDNEYKSLKRLERFATFTIPDRSDDFPSALPPLPPTRCHSASFAARNRQFSAALRQMSHGNIKLTEREEYTGLPPISPKSNTTESSSISSGSLSKPRPLLRNLTYTICSHAESTETEEGYGPSPTTDLSVMRSVSEMDQKVQEFPSEVEKRHLLFSEQVPFDSVYSIGSIDQQRYNDLIALSQTNKEHQESFLFPPLNWRKSAAELSRSDNEPTSESQVQTESLQSSRSNRSESSSSASSSVRKELKRVNFEDYPDDDILFKDNITYGDLMNENINEPDTSKERLRKFALAKIRKQIERERKRLQSMELLEGSEDEGSEDDDEDDVDESSEDDESDVKPVAMTRGQSHDIDNTQIPMATGGAAREPSIDYMEQMGAPPPPLPPSTTETDGGTEASAGSEKEVPPTGRGRDMDDDIISLPSLDSRPATAESGYRAMPPSRIPSISNSRQQSEEVDEITKEKDRLLEEWRKSGEKGPRPTTATATGSVAGSSSSLRPPPPLKAADPYHVDLDEVASFLRVGSPSDRDDKESESSRDKVVRVQGLIDLTRELPGEEKKIAAIWDEFNRDDRATGGMVDYEFSTLLDEMIMDVNSYKLQLTAGQNPNSSQSLQVTGQATPKSYEPAKFENRKYQTLTELVSLLSHNLRLISSETLEDHMASLISLISTILKKVRKNKTEEDYVVQITSLSAIRVLCDRIQEMQSSQNLKYADLSWLFRILCKYSSDTDSKIRPEASFCLARLVKVAGPALVVRPIYFILVMESEGGGGKTTTGAKTKAAAIDTLTYAMLTFPKEDFHNLEEIAGWVCLAMLNEERRIRQSALECLAVIANHLGGREKAVPLFHQLFLKEELDHFSRSPSPESMKTTKTGKSGKSNKSGGAIPFSVSGTVRLLTGPGFPIAQPIDAITARLDKDVLPVPSTKGLIEYAVNVPTGKDLVLLMTHMLDKDDDEWDFSSSTDSLDSAKSVLSKRSSVTSIGFSDIDWTGDGKQEQKKDEGELITPDVAYILLGKGRVNKQEVVLLDTYKKEIIPEILEMLENKKQGKGKKKRFAKLNQKRRRRRRKGKKKYNDSDEDGAPRRLIPTLSVELDDGDNTTGSGKNDSGELPIPLAVDDEVFEGRPQVVVEPPGGGEGDTSISMGTEESTNKT